jgi:EAL domain-containing protein (putative c-di-GMP-specific phosphodiesterase class I)
MDGNGQVDDVIAHLLRTVRRHLDLDVAFIAEFTGDMRIFRYLDGRPGETPLEVGSGHPITETYCHDVAAGRIDLIVDALSDQRVLDRPVTSDLGIRTYAGVPIRFSDGRTYGTLCCFSHDIHPEISARDIMSLRMVAEVASHYLERQEAERTLIADTRKQINALMADPSSIDFVFQPMVDLREMRTVGVEALARFDHSGPAEVFAAAAVAGLGIEFETFATTRALEALDSLPVDVGLSVNASAETLVDPRFRQVVGGVPTGRLTVEVTEHIAVESYDELVVARRWMHERGIALAIDDVGMGFSGLHHILRTGPDKLKIDRAVVAGVDADPARQAMVDALCRFADRTGMTIVAEGIETHEELSELCRLDVQVGQGYLLGRPASLAAVA